VKKLGELWRPDETARAGADGKWRVDLDKLKTGEAAVLTVKAGIRSL